MDKQISNPDLSHAVDYARRVFDHNLDWYKNADTKAEIVLTLDGVFLTFVTSSILMKPVDSLEILRSFTILTWSLFGIMSLSLAGSIFCAIACLWSRISLFKRARDKYFEARKIDAEKLETYVPETTFFFQSISRLDPHLYQKFLLSANKEFEVLALTADIHTLSKNVLSKHRFVDFSFMLAGICLLCFFALGISYFVALIGP